MKTIIIALGLLASLNAFATTKEIFHCSVDLDWVFAKRHAFLPLDFNADGTACKHSYEDDQVTGPCFADATLEKELPHWKMKVIVFETMGYETINVPLNYRERDSFDGIYYYGTNAPNFDKPLFDFQVGAAPMHCQKTRVNYPATAPR